MEVQIDNKMVENAAEVRISVRLTPRELSQVFLSGDTLIRLPVEQAICEDTAPVLRDTVFLSELAECRHGYRRRFAQAAAATAFAASVREQLNAAATQLERL